MWPRPPNATQPGLGDDEPGPLDHGQLPAPVPAAAWRPQPGQRVGSPSRTSAAAATGSGSTAAPTVSLTAAEPGRQRNGLVATTSATGPAMSPARRTRATRSR